MMAAGAESPAAVATQSGKTDILRKMEHSSEDEDCENNHQGHQQSAAERLNQSQEDDQVRIRIIFFTTIKTMMCRDRSRTTRNASLWDTAHAQPILQASENAKLTRVGGDPDNQLMRSHP